MSRAGSARSGAFAMAANFNQPNCWSGGDFDYSGKTWSGGFALLASNVNKILTSETPRGAAVPETGACIWSVSLMAALRVRRRTEW